MQTKTKTCTKCGEIKVISEFHKQKRGKFNVTSACKRCKSARNSSYYEDNREAIAEYYEKNKEHLAEQRAAYYEKNKKEIAAKAVVYNKANPDKMNAVNAKRRAAKLQASPVWSDKRKMQEFYTESKRREKETGIKHNVDHIVPLQNDLVCGLHNEFNLQVLTATENMQKSNNFAVETE